MKHPTLKLFSVYMLTLLLILLFSGSLFSQSIKVVEYNADWNLKNEVKWLDSLSNCTTARVIICDNKIAQTVKSDNDIVYLPTIIIFKDDTEMARFEANIMMELAATKEEVQEVINELRNTDE